MQIADAWFEDIPQQFKGKHNIEVLIKAFSRQMDELEKVFNDINELTTLEKATGVNLDYVGNILSLTRKDAQVILRNLDKKELSDELYRSVLKYKAIKNTCECTYEDIVGSIKLVWGVGYLSYVEPPDRPATIYIQISPFDIDVEDPAAERILAIKPAGVKLLYTVNYTKDIDESNIEKFYLRNICMHWGIPFWNCYVLDGSWSLDGSVLLDEKRRYSLVPSIAIKQRMAEVKENIEVSVITTGKLWNLDGSVKLDGSKQLNALYRKEML